MDDWATYSACAAVAVASLVVAYTENKKRKYPPGPSALPFIGNLHHMPKGKVCVTFAKWAKEYGPVFYLHGMGTSGTLVLNTYEAASDLLDKRGGLYSDREKVYHSRDLSGRGPETGTVFLKYGPTWRKHRRFMGQILGVNVVRRDFSEPQTRAVQARLKAIMDDPANVIETLARLFGETITEFTYGAHRDGDQDFVEMNKALSNILDRVTRLSALDAFLSYIPLPEWCPGGRWRRTERLTLEYYEKTRGTFNAFVQRNVDEGNSLPPSYVTKLLQSKEGKDNNQDDIDCIYNSAFILFRAGADTTLGIARQFIYAMICHPEYQTLAQKEIDEVCGDKPPTLADYNRLPYLTAVLLEVMRWNPLLPTGLGHRLLEDDVYKDWLIPRGTNVIVNIWAITRDPEHFPDPETFDPSRYLTPPAPAQDPRNLIFGFGRRVCPGSHWAWQYNWLEAANLLWAFNITGKVLGPKEFSLGFGSFTPPFSTNLVPRSEKKREIIEELAAMPAASS